MLNPFEVGRNAHLVEMLAVCRQTISTHCGGHRVPCVVDEDIHYRLSRMRCGVGFRCWPKNSLSG